MELEHSLLDFLCFVKCTVVLDGEELSPFLDLGCQILGFPAVSPREKNRNSNGLFWMNPRHLWAAARAVWRISSANVPMVSTIENSDPG
jgi:hypothetical protein